LPFFTCPFLRGSVRGPASKRIQAQFQLGYHFVRVYM
jgi:hypothetical protein